MYEDNFDVQGNFTSSKFSANEITAIELMFGCFSLFSQLASLQNFLQNSFQNCS